MAHCRSLPIAELQLQGRQIAENVALGLLSLLFLGILLPVVEALLRRWGRVERNFRGDAIPQSYGVVILIWTSVMFSVLLALFPPLRSSLRLWIVACVGFGLLGLADDLWGTKTIKGLRGHLNAALRTGTITTGLMKAIGGIVLALWLGGRVGQGEPARSLLAAALIALGANAINLLDLRPGRAGGVFLLVSLPLLVLALRPPVLYVPLLLLVVAPTALVWRRDARAEVMMGDTGSNLLGACLGLAVALTCPTPVQAGVLALLIALHITAERVSLTRVIEANPILRALDRLTGVR
jgi:UDP-N-acetylmuramyl pentapeptide phosphotransferase/UDP-N-acetylglucosamine-1-phosphate transferase